VEQGYGGHKRKSALCEAMRLDTICPAHKGNPKMSEKIKAKVTAAGFQYDGFFGDPILNNQRLMPLLQPLYEALKVWNIRPQDVKYKNAAAANDASVSFEIAFGKLVLSVSHTGLTLVVVNADWSQAEMVTQLVEACWKAVEATLGIKASRHDLQIAMTVVPEGKSQKEITKPFAGPWRLRPADEAEMCGVIIYTAHGSFLVDRAAATPQGIFAKIVHRFSAQITFSEVLKQLYEDEQWLLSALGLELE
jgi:hypothetical protein